MNLFGIARSGVIGRRHLWPDWFVGRSGVSQFVSKGSWAADDDGLCATGGLPSATDAPARELAKSAMCGRLRVGKEKLHVAGLVGAAMCSAC